MKKYKGLIAVLVAVVLISSLIACSEQPKRQAVTQVVTNADGEVVTDKNGEPVTETVEVEAVTDENGKVVTEVVTDKNGKPLTTVVEGETVYVTQNVTESDATTKKAKGNKSKGKKKETTTKAPVKKPAAPAKPDGLKITSVTQNSLVLSWNSVKCDGYQVQYSDDEGVNYTYLTKNTKSTKLTVKSLTSYTKYTFRIRAFNKNSAGTSTSKWAKKAATTKAANDKRYITFKVTLPTKANEEDVLQITVGDDVYKKKVNLDGSTVTIKTDKQYKGLVKFEAILQNTGSAYNGKTDKATCTFDMSGNGIYIFDGDDD
ncbi:MAG: fibronectin type III domain-containing protein [Ruminococcaceae bacterium]|nr:fibronectin type III domain-containing protein [Oscillospiraceae bacterium]